MAIDRPGPAPTRRLHFGVDDVLAAFLEAGESRAPLFAHPFFATLAALHAEFGIDLDLYLFGQCPLAGRLRSLQEVPDRVGEDLAGAPWLRLGPHALDYDHPPYRQSPEQQRATFTGIYREIDRLVGPARRSRLLRLHCFSESYALASFWRDHGVEALLLTDRPAVAYELPAATRAELAARGVAEHQGVPVRRTHERIENLAAAGLSTAELGARLDRHVAQHDWLVLCTHERELLRPAVRDTCGRCLRHARDRGLRAC